MHKLLFTFITTAFLISTSTKAEKLDSILDEVIADIEEDWGINNDMMMRIVETWSLGVSIRLPLTINTKETSNE